MNHADAVFNQYGHLFVNREHFDEWYTSPLKVWYNLKPCDAVSMGHLDGLIQLLERADKNSEIHGY